MSEIVLTPVTATVSTVGISGATLGIAWLIRRRLARKTS